MSLRKIKDILDETYDFYNPDNFDPTSTTEEDIIKEIEDLHYIADEIAPYMFNEILNFMELAIKKIQEHNQEPDTFDHRTDAYQLGE